MSPKRAQAVIYLRVSTKEQAETGGEAEGYSIPAQRDACVRKAESLGATVIDEFVDRGESAKSADRPELQRMLRYVKEESVRYVIVHKVDRLARNRFDDVQINLLLQQEGVQLVSCTEGIDETPSGMLLHGIMSSMAEFYSRNLANEVIKGSVQKAKSGGTVGKAVTGYLNHRIFENGREVRTIIVDPVRGALMTQAFGLYATGEWSIRNLLAEMTKRGLDSVPSAQRPSKPLTQSNFHRLLRHPYYKGIVRYRGVEYPGKHTPLVSSDTWQRVQDVLDSQGRSGELNREHPHYLKGTLFCGACNARMIVSHNRGNGGIYEYFVCLGRHQKRTTCTRSALRVEYLEQLVEDLYRTVQVEPGLVDAIREMLIEQFGRSHAALLEERAQQQRRLTRLEGQRQKLLDAYLAGAVPVDLLREKQAKISHEIEQAGKRADSLDVQFERVKTNLDKALDLAGNWYGAYCGSNERDRRQMNQAIFERIDVNLHHELEFKFRQPFAVLLNDEVKRAAVSRMLLQEAVDEAFKASWEEIAAGWRQEREGGRNADTHDTECVVGVKAALLVGGIGLGPMTPSV